MIPPIELPGWARVAITIIIAILIAVGLLLFLPDAGGETEKIPASKYESRLIQLDREAIEEAYKKHIMRLFDVWVTDYGASGAQPPRAVKGANNARRAYTASIEAIEQREQARLK